MSDKDCVIRSADLGELDRVLDVWLAAGAAPTITDDVAALEALLARDGEALIVAESDGAVVGTLIAAWDGWRGNMYRLAVRPEHRRRGVARDLVAEGQRRLRAHGCRRITALVLGDEKHAVEFWTAAGYEVQPEMDRFRTNLDD
ncbi:MAG: GNAT family N-acetyltransferase [Actinomycetota bacterium]